MLKSSVFNVYEIILTNILELCRRYLISSLSRVSSHAQISGMIRLFSTKLEECRRLYNRYVFIFYLACDFDEGHQDIWHLPALCLYYFRFVFDAMHAVTGAYAKPIFVDKLSASLVCLSINGANLIIKFQGKGIFESVFLKCFF